MFNGVFSRVQKLLSLACLTKKKNIISKVHKSHFWCLVSLLISQRSNSFIFFRVIVQFAVSSRIFVQHAFLMVKAGLQSLLIGELIQILTTLMKINAGRLDIFFAGTIIFIGRILERSCMKHLASVRLRSKLRLNQFLLSTQNSQIIRPYWHTTPVIFGYKSYTWV